MPGHEALPRVVDRYELVSVLGVGGFATVYRARHVHTRQDVACKLMRPRDSDRWLGEARAAAAVQHPNVVRVLDCGQAGDGEVFIVMDFVVGPTLADVLDETGPMPPARAVGVAAQILDGLSAAHALGIVHRDIKPPNVILTRDATGADLPKVLDFGVSKQLDSGDGDPTSRTRDGAAIGTPGYMAPELFGGSRHADFRADVYAVAATLYEMLSGTLPFRASTYEALVVAVVTQRPAPLREVAPHVPAEIAACVDRGLARDREARWATAGQFAAALRGALSGVMPASSQPFAATLEAQGSSPLVPTLPVPDPATMRTAPPPPRAPRAASSFVGWIVGGVGLALAAAAAVLVTLHTLPPTATSTALSARTETSAPPGVTVVPANATAPTASAPTPTAPAHTTTATGTAPAPRPSRGPGITVTFPASIVGDLRATAIDDLARSVLPQAERCRPTSGGPVVAHVQLHVHPGGRVTLAQPDPNQPGDVPSARCLAALMKDAATPGKFAFGTSGIASVEVKLAPR